MGVKMDMKILVVDDALTMRMIAKKLLREIGFTNIDSTDDGANAWPKLEEAIKIEEPFEFIICDWYMPKMSGIDLLKKVKADENMKSVPFLMVTSEAKGEAVSEAVTAGVSNYIVKPFGVEVLKEKIEKIFGPI